MLTRALSAHVPFNLNRSHIPYSKWNSLLCYLCLSFWDVVLNSWWFSCFTLLKMYTNQHARFRFWFFIFIYFLRKSLAITFSRLALNLEPLCLNSPVLGLPVSVPRLNCFKLPLWCIKQWPVLFIFLNRISKKNKRCWHILHPTPPGLSNNSL